MKRVYDVLAVALLLAGLGGMILGLYFLYRQQFIQAVVAGLLSFAMLRVGVLILRLMVARSSLAEAQRSILEHLGDGARRGEEGRAAEKP